jgi:GNAT superfamily N-acetyltransferase
VTEVRRLDGAAAHAAVPQLAEILADAVANGDSVSFLIPLSLTDATAFFESLLPEIERGTRVLLGAFDGEELVGTVQLAHAWQPNSTHRTEVVKLLVRRDRRGAGLGRLLMERLEEEAQADGKNLLLLDTVSGSVADGLYEKLGWTRIGVIPRYALDPHGSMRPAAFFYKLL